MADSTTTGKFPWDVWLQKALDAGMNEATATAGRAMMRECHEHDWARFMGAPIVRLCGFEDAGANMIAFGLAHPDLARRLWAYLEEDDAGENPRSRPPKDLQPLIMQSFRDRAFPIHWAEAGNKAAREIVRSMRAAEDRRSVTRAQLVPALEKITEALKHHWTTGSGRRLRQIVWSIYNASTPVVLGDALTNFDDELGGAVGALITAKICGVDMDDLLRDVLEQSGEMARYDAAAADTSEDEEVIYPPLPMSAEELRSLAASATSQERRESSRTANP